MVSVKLVWIENPYLCNSVILSGFLQEVGLFNRIAGLHDYRRTAVQRPPSKPQLHRLVLNLCNLWKSVDLLWSINLYLHRISE